MKYIQCILAVGLSVSLSGCGGGGGGDGNGDGGEPAPALPLVSRIGAGQATGQQLQLLVSGLNITMTKVGFTGTFNKETHARTVDVGTRVTADSGNLLGVLSVSVTRSLPSASGQPPTDGEIEIDRTGGHIELEFGPGNSNVEIRYTPTGGNLVSQHMTWSAFDDTDVADTDVAAYIRSAVLAYRCVSFLSDRMVEVGHCVMTIAAKETDLQHTGAGKTFTFQGDYLPPAFKRGYEGITWVDNGDPVDEVGPADQFTCVYDDMWVKDPATTDTYYYDGGNIRMINYLEGRNPTVLGFGHVQYSNLSVREVEEYPAGTYRFLGDPMLIGGDFNIIFTPAG